MIDFGETIDFAQIKNRGTVQLVTCPVRIRQAKIFDGPVKVDNRLWKVLAIQKFSNRMQSEFIDRGEKIGLVLMKWEKPSVEKN